MLILPTPRGVSTLDSSSQGVRVNFCGDLSGSELGYISVLIKGFTFTPDKAWHPFLKVKASISLLPPQASGGGGALSVNRAWSLTGLIAEAGVCGFTLMCPLVYSGRFFQDPLLEDRQNLELFILLT